MQSSDPVSVAKAIQRSTGPTFHIATRFLPERVRHPTYILYAFFRKADQVVDDPDPRPATEQRELLSHYERAVLGDVQTDDPVLAAMATVVEEYDLEEADIRAFIDAMRRDIDAHPYETHEELTEYLRGSAVSVGYMMLQVMDPAATSARPNAKALGEAFQLTNFLRDVREDVIEYDRVYVPRSTLTEHGATVEDIRNLTYTQSVGTAIRSELRRTADRYRTGVAGIDALPADCQFPVLLASVFYAEYHRMIERQGYNVIDNQPEFTKLRYLTLAARTWLEWKRLGDPEAVFYRVSPIDPPEQTEPVEHSDRFSRLTTSVYKFKTGLQSHLFPSKSD